MTSPALSEVHLLRSPGLPAGHHEEKSLQTSRIRFARSAQGRDQHTPESEAGAHGPHVGQWAQDSGP